MIRTAEDNFSDLIDSVQDLLEKMAAQYQAVCQDAITDVLTSLHNRRYFDRRLGEAVVGAQRYGHPLSLVFLDIDHFKAYNDRLGHRAGDELLLNIAQIMMAERRRPDLFARYGGDEFALLLCSTEAMGAHQLTERIQRAIMDELGSHVTFSAGIAQYGHHGHSSDAMFDAADKALHRAKAMGRGQICIADTNADTDADADAGEQDTTDTGGS